MYHHLNQIHHGNCIQIMNSLPDESIDLIVTDPPYLVNYRSRDGRSIAGDTCSNWLLPAFAEMYRLLHNNSFAISFYGWSAVEKFMTAWKQAGFYPVGHFVFSKHYCSHKGFTEARHECAYLLAKGRPSKPSHLLKDVIPWGKYTGNCHHPTQKPVEILRTLIRTYSEIGDIVLDPFAGSGSTAVAAHQMRRSWIGIELDATYHHNAKKRLSVIKLS